VIWEILHILAMFIAFGFTTGMGILMTTIVQRGDVRTIRTALKVARPLQIAGSIVLVVGIVFGFGAAAAVGYDLTTKWLVIAYVLAALLLIFGVGIHAAWSIRLSKAAEASPEDHPSAELTAVLGDRLVAAAGPISGLLWIALIAVMVLRPI
jgi:uncharacterized membrane protein